MNRMIRTLTAVMAIAMLAGCGTSATSTADTSTEMLTVDDENLIQETVYVEMDIQDYGKVVLELDGETAPVTVTNFVNLTEKGFYDGLTFHRIMDGFMIQGGDPQGDGYGGSSRNIQGEFAENGINNPISHKTGTISMARSSMGYDTASSQFFICVADDTFLDGSYAAFGHVTEGLDVVLQIAKDAEPIDDNGTILKEDQPVIKSVKVIDN